MSEYIPLEIQEEILKRLPVKPLVQFRSVSKPWKGLIDSPDFIVSYGVRHPHPDRFILRYELPYHHHGGKRYKTLVDKYITLVDNDDDDSLVQQDFVPTIPDLFMKSRHYPIEVVGSSNGLLCFKGYYSRGQMAVIWNPCIRKSVGIHVPYIYVSPDAVVGIETVIGFGVCPITFDPTILKIERVCNGRKLMPDLREVQVFSLSTGAWSILSTNLLRESVGLTGSQVVIDRFIYWFAYDTNGAERSQSRYLIMSFDLTAKVFKEINLTDSVTNPHCYSQTISKLRESLVLLEYRTEFEEDISDRYCLWMMMEQGDSRSFTKLYNINLLRDIRINNILGFRKTGELILETQAGFKQYGEVQVYNPNSKAIDNLLINGVEYLFFMCPYMETLLLLDQLDGFIYSMGTDHK